jgi:hypothetical protein
MSIVIPTIGDIHDMELRLLCLLCFFEPCHVADFESSLDSMIRDYLRRSDWLWIENLFPGQIELYFQFSVRRFFYFPFRFIRFSIDTDGLSVMSLSLGPTVEYLPCTDCPLCGGKNNKKFKIIAAASSVRTCVRILCTVCKEVELRLTKSSLI